MNASGISLFSKFGSDVAAGAFDVSFITPVVKPLVWVQ